VDSGKDEGDRPKKGSGTLFYAQPLLFRGKKLEIGLKKWDNLSGRTGEKHGRIS
jgi:hypothetical protein